MGLDELKSDKNKIEIKFSRKLDILTLENKI